MPRAGDPRIVLRLSDADMAVVEAAAEAAGVATGGLVRECAVRYAGAVAREVVEGRLTLRRRTGAAASSERPEPEPVPLRGGVLPDRELGGVVDPGVARAIAFRRATGRG